MVDFIQDEVYLANVFSPNSDGINDCFKPQFGSASTLVTHEFYIFDRWGNRVFESFEKSECWDGSFNGQELQPATFTWILKLNKEDCNEIEIQSGSITLIR